MVYDLKELEARINKLKAEFIIKLFILLLITLICVSIMLISMNGEAIIISGIVLFILFFVLRNLIEKYAPTTLFSKEVIGENIKEDEQEIMKRGAAKGGSMRYRQVGSSTVGTRAGAAPIAPNTRANKKSFHKGEHFSGHLYIKEENGNIKLITGLFLSQMEIYKEGDVLQKPKGCKYPMVISRDTELQVCPLCGENNGTERDRCADCGLKIIK